MKARLEQIRALTSQFTGVIEVFTESVSPPIFYVSDKVDKGFRYLAPTAKNFCIIKAVAATSGINAALVLAELGFYFEVCVLMRTVVEALSFIDFVAGGVTGDTVEASQQKFLNKYFGDFRRNSPDDYGGPITRQEELHKEIAKSHIEDMAELDITPGLTADEMKKLYSNIFLTYSNYVHARYPEVMELWGGKPEHFHVSGMGNTPKHMDSVEIVETIANSVSIALGKMIQVFNLHEAVKARSDLAHWIPSTAVKA